MNPLYDTMNTIGEAQAVIDAVIDALGADKIPGVRADVPAALTVASRLLTQVHEAIDRFAMTQEAR